MCSNILAASCRLCASRDTTVQMYQINGTVNNEFFIPELIKRCTSIEISETDECRNICESCLAKLDLMYQLCEHFKQGETDFNILLGYFDVKTEAPDQQILPDCQSDAGLSKFCVVLGGAIEKQEAFHESKALVKADGLDSPHRTEEIDGNDLSSNYEEKPFDYELHEREFESEYSTDRNSNDTETSNQGQGYACELCNKYYMSLSNLKQHRRIHTGEKPFECEFCEKSFSRKEYLKNHRKIHTGEKPYECDICYENFPRKQTLKVHIQSHSGVKPFECEICSKTFSRNEVLKEHSKIHTGVKPHECEVCHFKFIRKGDLIVHKRIHSGEKPFECESCNKVFSSKQNYTKHVKVHSASRKTYDCDLCDKSYIQSRGLKYHRAKHSKDERYTSVA